MFSIKGWLGEIQGILTKKLLLDSKTYIDLNNVLVRTGSETTQIDHVIVSKFGLFVVESKNIDGWIFGESRSPQWTQCLYGHKYKFQNPLHQNYRHTRVLSELLGIDHDKLFSVVMFWGRCEFKTPMPDNVLNSDYVPYILRKRTVLFSDREVAQMVDTIKAAMLPSNWLRKSEHVETLRKRYGSHSTCPKCSGGLVLRTAKSGARAGSQFYGCNNYPNCKYTLDAQGERK